MLIFSFTEIRPCITLNSLQRFHTAFTDMQDCVVGGGGGGGEFLILCT